MQTRKALAAQNRQLVAQLAAQAPETRAGLRRKVADALASAAGFEALAKQQAVEIKSLTAKLSALRADYDELTAAKA